MGMVGEGPMAQGRKRIEKHKASFEERIEQEAIKFKEAAEEAKQLVDGQGVELWQEGRKIATFDP